MALLSNLEPNLSHGLSFFVPIAPGSPSSIVAACCSSIGAKIDDKEDFDRFSKRGACFFSAVRGEVDGALFG